MNAFRLWANSGICHQFITDGNTLIVIAIVHRPKYKQLKGLACTFLDNHTWKKLEPRNPVPTFFCCCKIRKITNSSEICRQKWKAQFCTRSLKNETMGSMKFGKNQEHTLESSRNFSSPKKKSIFPTMLDI